MAIVGIVVIVDIVAIVDVVGAAAVTFLCNTLNKNAALDKCAIRNLF